MTRSAVFMAAMGVLCLTISGEVRAEPIRISGGSLVFPDSNPGELSIVGNRGFSSHGFVDSSETNVGPIATCLFFCVPGETIPARVDIFGSAFGGTVTLDGHTYEDVNSPVSGNSLTLNLSGTIDLPPFRDTPVTISAPFDADGFFRHIDDPFDPRGSPFFDVPIQGSGTVTLNLTPNSGLFWHLNFPLRYDFATPTPEPATLTMVGAPLVAALIRARKRRNRRTTIHLSTSTPTA